MTHLNKFEEAELATKILNAVKRAKRQLFTGVFEGNVPEVVVVNGGGAEAVVNNYLTKEGEVTIIVNISDNE